VYFVSTESSTASERSVAGRTTQPSARNLLIIRHCRRSTPGTGAGAGGGGGGGGGGLAELSTAVVVGARSFIFIAHRGRAPTRRNPAHATGVAGPRRAAPRRAGLP